MGERDVVSPKGPQRPLTVFVEEILQPIQLASEAFADLAQGAGGEGDLGHLSPTADVPRGCPHLALVSRAVIEVSVGAVHGSVAHGNDPRASHPVRVGFLERKV
jgi:hypothetical protein